MNLTSVEEGENGIISSDQDEKVGKKKKTNLDSLALTLLFLVSWCALKDGFVPLEDFQTLLNVITMLLLWLSFPSC